MLNENEVWAVLQKYGFEYAEFDGKSAREQIDLVASAEIVIQVGGAGNVITLFAPADCTIIDLTPPEFSGGLGSVGFSAVLGQAYGRVYTTLKDDGRPKVHQDTETPLDALEMVTQNVIARVTQTQSAG
jgi:capsular polysaccharide biosynthesis protein